MQLDHDKMIEHTAERLCTAMGYQWPCNYHRYGVKWENVAVSKYWIELAEHAFSAFEEWEARPK